MFSGVLLTDHHTVGLYLITVHNAQEVNTSGLIAQWQIDGEGGLTGRYAGNQVSGAAVQLNINLTIDIDTFQHLYVNHVTNYRVRVNTAK